MPKHRRVSSKRKIAPSLILGLTTLSIASPLAIFLNTQTLEEAEAETTLQETPFLSVPLLNPGALLAEAKRQALMVPSSTTSRATQSRPPNRPTTNTPVSTQRQIRVQTSTRPPTSRPTPTVTTRTSRPTVVQRQVQRATISPSPTQRSVARVTTTAHTSKAQALVPTTKRTTPPVLTTTTTRPPARSTSTSTPNPTRTATAIPTAQTKTTQVPVSSPTSTGTGTRIVAVAKTYVGDNLPYRMGGDSLTTGIDCSHFIHRVLTESGYKTTYRSSSALATWTKRVTDPQPGDLVLYSGHVGIYAGGGMMVHHGKPGGAFFSKVYTQNFIGYGRLP